MAFSDITANVETLRSGNEDILTESDYNDSQLQDLNKERAYFDLKLDLIEAQQITLSDISILNAIYDKYSEQLKRALAYKQLFIFYFEENNGLGSKTHDRMNYYDKKYAEEKEKFGKMKVTDNIFTKTVNIKRG